MRVGPLSLLVIGAFALPLVGSQAAESSEPTDRWPAANAPYEIDYAGAGFVSRPPGANARGGIAADEAVRALGFSPLAGTPEVALRLASRRPGNTSEWPYWVGPGQSRLVYVVVFHNVRPSWYGGPYRPDPATRPRLDPNLRCIEVHVLDAQSGKPVSEGYDELC
jgi:hypothetical protein